MLRLLRRRRQNVGRGNRREGWVNLEFERSGNVCLIANCNFSLHSSGKPRNRAAHLKFCDHAGNGVALFACPAGFVYKRLVQTGNRHEATVRHSHVYGDRSGYFRFYIKVYPHEYRQTHKAGGVGRTRWQSGYAYVVAKDSN